VASHPHFGEAKHKKIEKGCEYYCRNKGKLSGQVRHCNFYFVALLVFLVKWFSITFQFSNCNNWEHAPLIQQPRGSSHPPLKNFGSAHALISAHSIW